ncbi:hypothetical protein BX600DRAFT_442644 [Xylariales sp. PMI_506]|nr:hypothetical protein BX600DRAFT_442644 [Xylariales sp. PMI_506]
MSSPRIPVSPYSSSTLPLRTRRKQLRAMESLTTASYLFPNEIWSQILQGLVLEPLEVSQHLPTNVFCSNRAALRQLCLTSRRFLDIARPYLYETIIFVVDRKLSGGRRQGSQTGVGPSSGLGAHRPLILLLRTLLESPGLRPLVKNFALALPMISTTGFVDSSSTRVDVLESVLGHSALSLRLDPADRAILEAVGLPLESVTSCSGRVQRSHHSSWDHALELSVLSQKVLAALLCMTHQVERLLLQDVVAEASEVFNQTISKLITGVPEIPFLPRLKIVQFQLETRNVARDEHGPSQTPTEVSLSSPLLNQPTLQRMDILYSWACELDVPGNVQQGLARLGEMNLVMPPDISLVDALLDLMLNLKTLCIQLIAASTSEEQENDLNNVLLRHSDTLESFCLDTTQCTAVQTTYQLGPLGKLACLPQLWKLKSLTVEPHHLLDWLNANTWPRFWGTLPPNLVELTLRFMPENGEDLLRIWARSGVGVALRVSHEKMRNRMPHLRRIHLQPLPFSLRTADTLKQDLKEAGIALSWEDADMSLSLAGLSIH